ncbi:hypothetical protein Back11_17140 [Paenibacillus baekrokdamisoli]|uniref:Uncharacterized protein n=1 Tax=Paenibacillus baekrokdamisoli TaxID=1712516 RepID=A0A3G9JBI8_9BACL|nr:hypothetical protein Back11_17140 [Paenibacillus baekrokdamisoli]
MVLDAVLIKSPEKNGSNSDNTGSRGNAIYYVNFTAVKILVRRLSSPTRDIVLVLISTTTLLRVNNKMNITDTCYVHFVIQLSLKLMLIFKRQPPTKKAVN